MKKFSRSIVGKTTLFLISLFSTLLLLGSFLAMFILFEADFYSKKEDQLFYFAAEEFVYRDSFDEFGLYLSSSNSEKVEDNGNFVFEIVDVDGNVVKRSRSAEVVEDWQYEYYFYENGEYDYDGFRNLEDKEFTGDYYIIKSTIINPFQTNDKYSFLANSINLLYRLRYNIYLLALILLVVDVYSFVSLISAIGYNNENDKLHSGLLNKVPFDLLLVISALIIFVSFLIPDYVGLFSGIEHLGVLIIYVIVFSIVDLAIIMGLITTFISRLKTKTLIKNTITYQIVMLLKKILLFGLKLIKTITAGAINLIIAIPIVWKAVVATMFILFLDFLFHNFLAYHFIKFIVLLPLVVYLAINMKQLKDGAERLANGDLSNKIATKHLILDFKKHGENLNQVSKGMSIAVEDRLKSERMKTELITNVSHDIKTPLTSIINYASLIGEEDTENQKIKEYSEVLVRQSERLKRLIEDLVEVSKASTGNLEVNLSPCDANVFLTQASGEYAEKLENSRLTLITKQPDEEIRIMADGRRMWRIFDNLMNNICKYAQPETRVYLSIENNDDQAVITFKNTSKEQLDISEEELMERFTRGDHSRNTEGNGLGLSIAKSLAELQNGSLKLEIDGDLFKAILSFPVIQF
ncbi:MAG: histidine kinase dimerization/phospho-acceptor domain-containing protein [Bacillota bacterium]|jgi:signal transduction histidine kinase|nr:histidine kinase dimerization/phospho-acceptor domain-containing protein [Bacillota bacterium]NLL26802.1 GHKL domain-containing protein [Erysipelotrichia bacterium]